MNANAFLSFQTILLAVDATLYINLAGPSLAPLFHHHLLRNYLVQEYSAMYRNTGELSVVTGIDGLVGYAHPTGIKGGVQFQLELAPSKYLGNKHLLEHRQPLGKYKSGCALLTHPDHRLPLGRRFELAVWNLDWGWPIKMGKTKADLNVYDKVKVWLKYDDATSDYWLEYWHERNVYVGRVRAQDAFAGKKVNTIMDSFAVAGAGAWHRGLLLAPWSGMWSGPGRLICSPLAKLRFQPCQ